MYIHSNYKIINSNKDIKEYKKEIKEVSKINLRRSSKFNILAVLGAIKLTQNIKLSDNLGIYVASEYGPIGDAYKMMKIVSKKEHIVMPFDFLNINSNNISFYVSQALKAKGQNKVITSRYLSFEKALELAKFDLDTKEVKDILIGGVDESLLCVKDFDKYLYFNKSFESKDGSCWFYLNNKKENSIGKIINIFETNSISRVKELLKNNYLKIALNQFAILDKNIISSIDKSKLIPEKDFYGCEGALHILNLLKHKGKHIYIAKDNNRNFIIIELEIF